MAGIPLPVLDSIETDPSSFEPQQAAPNYRPADRPGQNCASCRFFRYENKLCSRYGFKAADQYVCDGFEAMELGGGDIKTAAALGRLVKKSQNLPNANTPLQGMSAMSPSPTGNPSGWRGDLMVGTQEAALQPGIQGMKAQLRQQLFSGVGAMPQQPQQQQAAMGGNDIPPAMGQATQEAGMQAQAGTVQQPKLAAVHALATPYPKDWNGSVDKPNKLNGGVASYGNEAWKSADHYRNPKGTIAPPPSVTKSAQFGAAMATIVIGHTKRAQGGLNQVAANQVKAPLPPAPAPSNTLGQVGGGAAGGTVGLVGGMAMADRAAAQARMNMPRGTRGRQPMPTMRSRIMSALPMMLLGALGGAAGGEYLQGLSRGPTDKINAALAGR